MKIGGNVASYFCLSDGTVVHAVAGPLEAKQFLREAKWAADVRKLAMSESGGDVNKYRATIRKAHLERLSLEHGYNPTNLPQIGNAPVDGSEQFAPRPPATPKPPAVAGPPPTPSNAPLRVPVGRGPAARKVGTTQGQVHILLAYYPLPKLSQLHPIVFQDILKERLSTLPVQAR